jgi:hypothetical protein
VSEAHFLIACCYGAKLGAPCLSKMKMVLQ